MKIQEKRIKDNILNIGRIGESEEGINRIAFSKEFIEARNILERKMKSIGLRTKIDGVGNLIGRKQGILNEKIMIGSHLDTVVNGGLLDGNLGVIASLECMMVMDEFNYSPKHTIEIVCFNAEEGSELGGTFGSRAMNGQVLVDEKNKNTLSSYGIDSESINDTINKEKILTFLELHIEQGGILENRSKTIGIVENIVGISRYKITVLGEENHSGTTSMDLRKDALVTASEIIVKVNKIAKLMNPPFVATVGILNVLPNSVSIIPGKVEFIVELRDVGESQILDFMVSIKEYINSFKKNITVEELVTKPHKKLSNKINTIVEDICIENNISYLRMDSGAGHDCKEFVDKTDVGLIFIPSINGKSHCKEEMSNFEDIYTGVQLLLDVLLYIDGEYGGSL
ncbi:MAG: M20 family metallo-hydrolase [Tissierellia bacterium]|nr:M20 family metallo-hydrolase [Tissierellia bacterium]